VKTIVHQIIAFIIIGKTKTKKRIVKRKIFASIYKVKPSNILLHSKSLNPDKFDERNDKFQRKFFP